MKNTILFILFFVLIFISLFGDINSEYGFGYRWRNIAVIYNTNDYEINRMYYRTYFKFVYNNENLALTLKLNSTGAGMWQELTNTLNPTFSLAYIDWILSDNFMFSLGRIYEKGNLTHDIFYYINNNGINILQDIQNHLDLNYFNDNYLSSINGVKLHYNINTTTGVDIIMNYCGYGDTSDLNIGTFDVMNYNNFIIRPYYNNTKFQIYPTIICAPSYDFAYGLTGELSLPKANLKLTISKYQDYNAVGLTIMKKINDNVTSGMIFNSSDINFSDTIDVSRFFFVTYFSILTNSGIKVTPRIRINRHYYDSTGNRDSYSRVRFEIDLTYIGKI